MVTTVRSEPSWMQATSTEPVDSPASMADSAKTVWSYLCRSAAGIPAADLGSGIS